MQSDFTLKLFQHCAHFAVKGDISHHWNIPELIDQIQITCVSQFKAAVPFRNSDLGYVDESYGLWVCMRDRGLHAPSTSVHSNVSKVQDNCAELCE